VDTSFGSGPTLEAPPMARSWRLSAFGRGRRAGSFANLSLLLIGTSAPPRAERGNATRRRMYFGGYVTVLCAELHNY
jgi:hypothetical protein